ncbi:MarR family winged helix-turn-helix transcriptional regulator [Pseudoalteromonas xiamenensis]
MLEESVDLLVINLMNLQSKIQKRVGSSLSIHGLGLSDYFVLNQLYITTSHIMSRNELAERVGLSPSGITRLLNPLEKIGLVEKETNPRDSRVSLVKLTATGKQIYEEAKVSFTESSRVLFSTLDSTQQNQLSVLLKTLM